MFHISLSGGAWSIVWGYNPTKVPPWWWDWNGHQLLWGWKTHFWGEICHDICHHNTVTTTLSPRHLSLQHCQSYEMFYTRLRNLIKSIETKMTPQAGGSAHMTQQHLPAVTLQQGSPNFLFEVNISTTVRGPDTTPIIGDVITLGYVAFYWCNLSGGVALIVWFTTNGMCVKNNTIISVARASNSKRDCEHDLYCCLLPWCEALRTCRSGFPIATLPYQQTFVNTSYTIFDHWKNVFAGIWNGFVPRAADWDPCSTIYDEKVVIAESAWY